MKYKLSHVQIIAIGFFIIILIGTVLLMMPIASIGERASFTTAFFTATSSTCVTGLVLRDTATGWSLFGQIVIISLIQIGGLGFMTFATFTLVLFRKRMGIRARETMMESINTNQIGGIMKLAKKIVVGTAVVEGTGALLLMIRFIPTMGILKGIWYGVFHAVSAFCNAGFDLMGVFEPYTSLVPYYNDIFVNLVIIWLITVGGLGFLVWEDVVNNKFNFKAYRLHSKVVLTVSAVLTFGGAVLMFILERGYTGQDLSLGNRLITALFTSVTMRTAGFNTVDLAMLSPSSKLICILLMIVGGSPGSTAGGAKTTTIIVLVLYAIAGFKGQDSPTIYGKRLPDDSLKKATIIVFFNVGLAIMAAILICGIQRLDLIDVLFETFSAIGTVGVTAGITRDLSMAARYIIILLMYMGRVGSVSFAVAILEKKAKPRVSYPVEEITIG